jgi:hypothetical protein
MKNIGMTIMMVSAILAMIAGQGFSANKFNDGGTYNINYDIGSYPDYDNEVWVDYQAPGMQTTVNLFAGGNVGDLVGFNDSRINVLGGTVGAGVLEARDNSQVTILGGTIYSVMAFENSQITMSGGIVEDGGLGAYADSHVTISGGRINQGLWVLDNSQVTMSGGTIRDSIAVDAKLIIEGSNFAIGGSVVGYGQYFVSDIFGKRLTGILANGDVLNNQIEFYQNEGLITLTPEPATVTIMLLGATLCAIKRKR